MVRDVATSRITKNTTETEAARATRKSVKDRLYIHCTITLVAVPGPPEVMSSTDWKTFMLAIKVVTNKNSVVGASIIGGDTVDHGRWVMFWFFLAQLNFVLGAINLVPLLPFDRGHIAIAVFEKIRNMIRAARGMVVAAPVNYLKLMPATYVVLAVVVGYMALTVTADLVNPIRLFQ